METPSVTHRLVTATCFAILFFARPLVAAPATTVCDLQFEAKGTDIQIVLGYSKLKGQGQITCIAPDGKRETQPMKVQIGTPVIFPRISFAPSLTVHGSASGIEILKGGPKVIFGKYLTVDIRAAVGKGFASTLALQGEDNGLTFDLDLDDVEGFGIAVGGTIVRIE